MRCRRSAIASSGMSTRKGRISVSPDISNLPDWLMTVGRTGRPRGPGQGPSPAPAEQLAPPHDGGSGGRIAPVTFLVRTPAWVGQPCGLRRFGEAITARRGRQEGIGPVAVVPLVRLVITSWPSGRPAGDPSGHTGN